MKDGKRNHRRVARQDQEKSRAPTGVVRTLTTISSLVGRAAHYEGPLDLSKAERTARMRARWRESDNGCFVLEDPRTSKVFRQKAFLVGHTRFRRIDGSHITILTYHVREKVELNLSPGELPVTLYHGTSMGAFGRILMEGWKPTTRENLLLGPGVYFGSHHKAAAFQKHFHDTTTGIQSSGVMIQCRVALGKIREGTLGWESRPRLNTTHGIANVTRTWTGTLHQDEWCVHDPTNRIQIDSVRVYFPLDMNIECG